jgi:UDP-N-acetylmuramate dehydrogenase
MDIKENVSLAEFSTMRLGGTARYMVEVHDRTEVAQAVAWAKAQQVPFIVIGGGSNIVWRDEGFNGLLIVNKILRYESQPEDDTTFYITAGAGENWDSVVARAVEMGLGGIECLSLIPGSTGATPVQNVGAYGQEIADTLVTVEAYDTDNDQFINLMGSDCNFSYRNSRFKAADKGRFIITAITQRLSKTSIQPPFYGSFESYFDESSISD